MKSFHSSSLKCDILGVRSPAKGAGQFLARVYDVLNKKRRIFALQVFRGVQNVSPGSHTPPHPRVALLCVFQALETPKTNQINSRSGAAVSCDLMLPTRRRLFYNIRIMNVPPQHPAGVPSATLSYIRLYICM